MAKKTTKDDSAPATKKDVELLMREFGKLYEYIDKKVEASKTDIITDVIHQVKILEENLRDDFRAYHEQLSDHGVRIKALEHYTGLAKA